MPLPYARKPSIVDRVLGRLFPTAQYAGLLDPEQQQGLQRQGLLNVGLNLLQAGGRSAHQQGTLANIGAAIQGVNFPEMAQQALALQTLRQQKQETQQVTDLQQQSAKIDDPAERIRALLADVATLPGGRELIGPLSNALAQLNQPRTRWSILPVQGTDAQGNPVILERNAATGETRVAKDPEGKPIRAWSLDRRQDQDYFMRANQLYGRWLQETAPQKDIALNYSTVLSAAADPSPAGDLALIFAYMKMLDPGSVVREGEFATAANTGSVPERVRAQYNKAINGERLTATQRTDFLNQAKSRARAVHQGLQRMRADYGKRASRYGIGIDDVTSDYFGTMLNDAASRAGSPANFDDFLTKPP